jgi:monoamine oxidase
VEIHDWSDSPYTSPPNVADLTDYELFGSPLLGSVVGDGRLYFTSTETATDAPGHIQGALSAARRTAAAILAQTVGPPV